PSPTADRGRGGALRKPSQGTGSVPGATCCLPSGLSPSALEFHQVSRPPQRPGRGLSPPVRTFTDPGARWTRVSVSHTGRGRHYDLLLITGRGHGRARPRDRSVPVGAAGQVPQGCDLRARVLGPVDRRAGDEHIGSG